MTITNAGHMSTTKTFGIWVLLVSWLCKVQSESSSDFGMSSLLQDPRHNSSFFDLVVKNSSAENLGVLLVGNVANVLSRKGQLPNPNRLRNRYTYIHI